MLGNIIILYTRYSRVRVYDYKRCYRNAYFACNGSSILLLYSLLHLKNTHVGNTKLKILVNNGGLISKRNLFQPTKGSGSDCPTAGREYSAVFKQTGI